MEGYEELCILAYWLIRHHISVKVIAIKNRIRCSLFVSLICMTIVRMNTSDRYLLCHYIFFDLSCKGKFKTMFMFFRNQITH